MARNYVFTINNYTEGDLISLDGVGRGDANCKGISYQTERGKENGTIHLQGYVEFSKVTTKRQANLALGNRARLGIRRGTREQAIQYTEKKETRIEGPRFNNHKSRSQGARTDLVLLQHDLDEGMSFKKIGEKHFPLMLRYPGGISRYRILHADTTWREVEVNVYWGATGTGKTRKAWEDDPELFCLPEPTGNSVWFDGYHGQRAMLIDEFYGQIKWSFLLKLLDGHYLPIPIKGGMTFLEVTKITITSNIHPSGWYNYNEGSMNYETLKRRINKITEF